MRWLTYCVLCAAVGVGGPAFKMLEPPGPHPVGLRVVEQYDYSREFQPAIDEFGKPYSGERARPLQTLIWYPAQRTDAKPMTIGDYVAFEATETTFGSPKRFVGYWERLVTSMKPILGEPTMARRDAPFAPGRFPVIVYAPSFSSVSWENLDLCEYLASYGYVVIAVPGMGVSRESTHDVAGTNEQARDISFLIAFARTLPYADMSAIGVVGFSWGGLANLFAAARDDRIDALVALDGSMRYYPGVVNAAADVRPEQMTIPLLYFKGQGSLEDQSRLEQDQPLAAGPNVLNEWTHGDLIGVQILGLFHPEFSSLGERNEMLWECEAGHLQEADYNRADGMIGYAWVSRYTRVFLDAHLKRDTLAMTFLRNTPAENGVPLHVMGLNFRPAQPLPVAFTAFRVVVGRAGFDRAVEMYQRQRKEEPGFHLDADAVVSWAYELLADGDASRAVDIMKLGVLLDPSSRDLSSLGEMYLKTGQRAEAIASYRQALEKDTTNISARQALNELQKGAF